jgi:hypothetical protein
MITEIEVKIRFIHDVKEVYDDQKIAEVLLKMEMAFNHDGSQRAHIIAHHIKPDKKKIAV